MKLFQAIFVTILSFISHPPQKPLASPIVGYVVSLPSSSPSPTSSPRPTPFPIFNPKIIYRPTSITVGNTAKWGVSQQLDTHTWTIRVNPDSTMATPANILNALNTYRIHRGSQPLTLNDNLAQFAQSRANFIYQNKSTDEHAGFINFLQNQDGYNKLGFTWLGENISYGLQMNGVHLIEWVYAGDKPHDDNQVDNKWNYVGIGVKGTATSIIFGTGKR